MRINKTVLCAAAGLCMLATGVYAETAEQSKAPIVIVADRLAADDSTGAFSGEGNVHVTQQDMVITSELLEGNSHTSDVWVKDKADFIQQKTKLVGQNLTYNYKSHFGSIQEASGKIDRERVYGNQIELMPDKDIIRNGWMTKCPAKVPDYKITAEWIEVWPGDYYIAHNAKFWIKNTVIYSMSKYKGSLKKDDKDAFPTVGYNSDGLYIKQHLETPISRDNKVSVFADLNYYSKLGLKPMFGVSDRESSYELQLLQGYDQDSDGYWIRKEPEFNLRTYDKRLGDLPVSYNFTAQYGKWSDGSKSSWHQEYGLNFTRDPIKLNPTTKLYLNSGVKHLRESYDGSQTSLFKFNASVVKRFSQRFSSWVGYNYTSNNHAVFSYKSIGKDKEGYVGFNYVFDKMNSLTVNRVYNFDTKRVSDIDYTWNRSLHCWDLHLTYRAKRDQIRWDISVARF